MRRRCSLTVIVICCGLRFVCAAEQFPPVRNVTVKNITCECGNGLVPCIWPPGSVPGHGGNLSDITFDGAKFIRSNMAIAIKSLGSFVGHVSNVRYSNFVLEDVNTAVMMNVYGQNDARQHQRQLGVASFSDIAIVNVSGTARSPGKFLCDSSATCTSISMRNVRLNLTGSKDDAAYTCSNAYGSSLQCQPKPSCLLEEAKEQGLVSTGV